MFMASKIMKQWWQDIEARREDQRKDMVWEWTVETPPAPKQPMKGQINDEQQCINLSKEREDQP